MTTRRRKAWRKAIEEAGVTVYVFERPGSTAIYREVRRDDGTQDRKSLGHGDRVLALEQARELARRIAELRLTGPVRTLTLGRLFTLYFAERAPHLSAKRRSLAENMYKPYFTGHLGESFALENFSQTQVDSYVAGRRTRTIVSPKARGVSTAPRDGTVGNELRWLKSVIRWARNFRVGGRPLLTIDPLAGVQLPREKNVKRPIASEDRYTKTLKVADSVDPHGRLACMLALARFTGRRVNAIAHLRANDVYLTRDQVTRALGAAGQDERRAEHMPHGALAFREDHDKLGYFELTPLSTAGRAAIDRYFRLQPRLGDAPLFPEMRDPSTPSESITRNRADYLLRRAESVAGVPKLERGLWHAYRRLWASERKHLPDVDVSRAGGWRDLATMKQAYQQPDAATTLRVVENAPDKPSLSPTASQSADAATS
ncbi:MAG TPA: hypothetical protein VGH98_23270 [Gemmatimonadaceae bacterium]|jgi:hypothetical protein